MAATTGFLELTGVSKRYGETLVLNDLDISIGQGEFISLIGPGPGTPPSASPRCCMRWDP
jgi:ABC-type Fe3+/spermidine/putrescine transport system ATPase subunit